MEVTTGQGLSSWRGTPPSAENRCYFLFVLQDMSCLVK